MKKNPTKKLHNIYFLYTLKQNEFIMNLPAASAKLAPQNTEIQPQRRRRRKRDEILGCFRVFLCGLKHLFRTAAFFGP
jgi:hypothetical protein